MPGVPPDALAQLKRGLKGIFSRKRKTQEPTASTEASTAAAATTASGVPMEEPYAATQPTPQISEPANVESSMNIDLNPSSSTQAAAGPASALASAPVEAHIPAAAPPPTSVEPTATTTHATTTAATTATPVTTAPIPSVAVNPPTEGMSATSGPLSGNLENDYATDKTVPLAAEVAKAETAGATAAEGNAVPTAVAAEAAKPAAAA